MRRICRYVVALFQPLNNVNCGTNLSDNKEEKPEPNNPGMSAETVDCRREQNECGTANNLPEIVPSEKIGKHDWPFQEPPGVLFFFFIMGVGVGFVITVFLIYACLH